MAQRRKEVILVMVMSVDGKITMGENPDVSGWTSREDKAHFKQLLDWARVVVMGRRTYEVAKDAMEHKDGRLRIVITRNPEKYQSTEYIKFTDKLPKYADMLVVGGSEIATKYLKEKLITRILLTIEPWVFGKGISLLNGLIDNVCLKLESVKRLNRKGSLLLEYRVEYED